MKNTKNTTKIPSISANHHLIMMPRPPLAFQIGVVGHRPNRLVNANIDQLNQVFKTILSAIKNKALSFLRIHPDLNNSSNLVLRAISPLAEGIDRLFAEQAICLGFEICCIMPFCQAEFEKDFAFQNASEPDSLARFRGILKQAEEESKLIRIEMNGSRDNPQKAYGDAGSAVVDQSDLLIAVWDGKVTQKIGGTEETFREARNCGMHIIWVDAQTPHAWQLIAPGDVLPEGNVVKPVQQPHHEIVEVLGMLIKRALDLPNMPATESTKI